jgi:hypothetical protein
MFCYGLCADATDEYHQTSGTIATKSLKWFCIAVRVVFDEYH